MRSSDVYAQPVAAQAKEISNGVEALHEAHLHVLVNVTKHSVLLLEQRADRLCCLFFTPGYKHQRELTIEEIRKLVAQPEPPVIMHLQHNHFNALMPKPSPPRKNVFELDSE